MERGGGIGLWIAHGAILLFLLVLAFVVVRTVTLYGSLVAMALLSRRHHPAPADPPPTPAPPCPDPPAAPPAAR